MDIDTSRFLIVRKNDCLELIDLRGLRAGTLAVKNANHKRG